MQVKGEMLSFVELLSSTAHTKQTGGSERTKCFIIVKDKQDEYISYLFYSVFHNLFVVLFFPCSVIIAFRVKTMYFYVIFKTRAGVLCQI